MVRVDARKMTGRRKPSAEFVDSPNLDAAWRGEVGERWGCDPLGQGMLGAVPRIEPTRHGTHERA
jgi:hypothetical protein